MEVLHNQGIHFFRDSDNAIYDLQAIKEGKAPTNYDWPRSLGITSE